MLLLLVMLCKNVVISPFFCFPIVQFIFLPGVIVLLGAIVLLLFVVAVSFSVHCMFFPCVAGLSCLVVTGISYFDVCAVFILFSNMILS